MTVFFGWIILFFSFSNFFVVSNIFPLLHSRYMHLFLARCTSNHVPSGGLRGKISLSSTFLVFDRSSLLVTSFLVFIPPPVRN